MCNPIALAVVAVAGSLVQSYQINKAADRQEAAIREQSAVREAEIRDQKSVELNERAREARRQRAAARVSASESGINLGSNSFLAMLQASEIQQSIDSGVIIKNESNMQRGRKAETKSALAGIHRVSPIGALAGAAQAGASAYSGAGGNMFMGRQPGRG